jgi:hypothetical protein
MADLEYDEDKAIKFILERVKEDWPDVKEEDVELVTDILADYYDSKGVYENEDENAMVDIDEDEIFDFVMDELGKEGLTDKYSEGLVSAILDGEFEYCESIGLFE